MRKIILSDWKFAGKVLLRTVLSTILCAFLFLSMSVLSLGLLGSNVGYRITEQTASGEVVIVKEYYYEPGEAEVDSLELPEGQRLEQIREVSPGVQRGADVVTQLLMLVVIGAFPYTMLWSLGDKDFTAVRYKNQKYEPLRGLKIGLLSAIPYAVLYLLLFASKYGVLGEGYLAAYRLIYLPYLPYINAVIPATITTATDASVWQLIGILPVLLLVPAVCCVAYILGYKQISLHERITYVGVKKGNADTEI